MIANVARRSSGAVALLLVLGLALVGCTKKPTTPPPRRRRLTPTDHLPRLVL